MARVSRGAFAVLTTASGPFLCLFTTARNEDVARSRYLQNHPGKRWHDLRRQSGPTVIPITITFDDGLPPPRKSRAKGTPRAKRRKEK